jgi:hypothetical protein
MLKTPFFPLRSPAEDPELRFLKLIKTKNLESTDSISLGC